MKIAFLSYYSGTVNRGVETYVYELSTRLRENNETIVFSGKENGGKNIEEFTIKVLSRLPKDIDCVVATNGRLQSLFCRVWTWINSKKLIIPGQSGLGLDDRINLICRPDVFIALTEYQKKWAVKNGFGTRVEKIPNGVDLDKFNPKVKSTKIDLPKPIFLCVAGLENGKRVNLTIEAVAKLKTGSLLILGDGTEKEKLLNLGRQLLPGRMEINVTTHDKMSEYYSEVDVFTMVPIPNESFGIVYVEAMACGKPVVATNDPIRREIVGDAGIYVNPENIDAYANALEEALEKDWGNLPRRQAEKFSWDKIAQQYEELFRSI